GSVTNVQDWLGGEFGGDLSDKDDKLLGSIRDAQNVPVEDRTDEQKTLAALIPENDALQNYSLTGAKTGTGYVTTSSSTLADKDGNTLSTKELTNLFKNGVTAGSGAHELYENLLEDAPAFSVSVKSKEENMLDTLPAPGSLVNVNGRLMLVKTIVRRGSKVWDDVNVWNFGSDKTTSGAQDGRAADTFTLVDLSSGTENTFDGSSKGVAASGDNSYKNLKDWAP
ncbi:unnamed protein product, partial [marine sediment metagenome]